MSPTELLVALRAQGCSFRMERPSADDWRLIVDVPRSQPLSSEQRDLIRTNKRALLELLWSEPHPSDHRDIRWSDGKTKYLRSE